MLYLTFIEFTLLILDLLNRYIWIESIFPNEERLLPLLWGDKVEISITMRKRHPGHIKHASNEKFQDTHSIARGFLWQLWEDFLILDEEMTASMSVCAHKDSACASLRPLMKLIEISFHGVIWLAGTVTAFLISHRVQDIEVIVNLLFGKGHVFGLCTS